MTWRFVENDHLFRYLLQQRGIIRYFGHQMGLGLTSAALGPSHPAQGCMLAAPRLNRLLTKLWPVSFRKVWDALSGDEVLTLAHKHIVKTVSFTQVRGFLCEQVCDSGTLLKLSVCPHRTATVS